MVHFLALFWRDMATFICISTLCLSSFVFSMEFSLWGCLQKDIDQKEYFWSMMFFSDYTLLPRGSRKGKASQKVRLLFLSFTG